MPSTPVSMMSQRFYDAAFAVTDKYSKAMRKHLFIIIGVMMYIAFVVMATVYYAPSYYACLAKNGTVWSMANSMVHAIFIVFLLFYVFGASWCRPKTVGSCTPRASTARFATLPRPSPSSCRTGWACVFCSWS